jgi:CHAD domain-containing protein
MDRALIRAEKIEPRWNAGDIHALRVAFRRSRTMAEALAEVNPAPKWRKIKKTSRNLFQSLGAVRDTQVARIWVRKLGPASDPVRTHLLDELSRREKQRRKLARKALANFDRKHWRKLRRKLNPRAAFFPLESVVFQRIAAARMAEAFDLYQQARRRRSTLAWHRARIGVKHFRYVVENFLPQRYAQWERDLKRFQDLLGEIHDLDILRILLRGERKNLDAAAFARWQTKIDRQRKERLKEFQQKSSAPNSPWTVWREGFNRGRVLVPAVLPQRRTA